jgi:hypothetical protein
VADTRFTQRPGDGDSSRICPHFPQRILLHDHGSSELFILLRVPRAAKWRIAVAQFGARRLGGKPPVDRLPRRVAPARTIRHHLAQPLGAPELLP